MLGGGWVLAGQGADWSALLRDGCRARGWRQIKGAEAILTLRAVISNSDSDVAFTMKQYVQTDLEADRQVANTLAGLIIGGSLASTAVGSLANPLAVAYG